LHVLTKNWHRLLCSLAVLMFAHGARAESTIRETFGEHKTVLPENVFPAAEQIDFLFYFILYLTAAICFAVFAVMVGVLIRYRYRPGRHASYFHGNVRLEAVWTLIPTIILVLIASFSQATWTSIKTQPLIASGEEVIRMEIVAKQFAWYFHYAGADGKLGHRSSDLIDLNASEPDAIIGLDRSLEDAKDDIVSTVMVVPVNTKVFIDLSSVDVLHSFFLPNFRIKQDAIPGLDVKVWIESVRLSSHVIGISPDEPVMFGYAKPFDIACAELCGQGHFKMRGKLYVVTRQQYEAFLIDEASFLDLGGEDGEEDYEDY